MRGTASLVFVGLLAASAAAQETTTGSIAGRVVDQQNLAVPGAAITVVSPQGPKSYVTDADGRFFAPFLTPGTYSVKVLLQGFSPLERTGIEVRLGQRVELTLPLKLGGLAEAVTVNQPTPLIDTSRTTVSTTLDSTLLAGIPVGRRFSDNLTLAPGVSSGGQVGAANPSVAGGTGLDNHYVIDGINVSNAGFGALGSYSIVFGSLGNGVPFDFIKEEQIQTSGFSAEFGQSSGGVVNVITRSGSNQFRGSLFAYLRPSDLESNYEQVDTTNGTVNIRETRVGDLGGQVGGPVLKDKVFYFGAIDPQWERTQYLAPVGFPLRPLGGIDQSRRIISYAAKGTYQFNPTQHVDGTFFGDPAKGLNGPQRYQALRRTDTSGFSELTKYGGHNQAIKYEGALGSHLLLEGSVARAENEVVETPSVNLPSVTDTTVTPQVVSGGIGFFEQGNRGVNWQYNGKATSIIGAHQIRYGLTWEHIRYDQTNNRTGPTFALPDGTQTTTGAQIQIIADPTFGRIFRVVRANTRNVAETKARYLNVFAQDTWKIGAKLTVTPGVRYERQKLEGLLEELTLSNNWAPRLGATYDPSGTGRMKVYGNWGFFFSKIPNDLAARALSADAGVSRADYFDLALTQPVPDGVVALGTTQHFLQQGLTADAIDPDTKSSYVNESVVGFEIEAAPSLNLGARVIYRKISRVVEDVQPFPVVASDLGIPGADDATYTLTNPGPDTPVLGGLGASFEKPVHHYTALELTANKRFSNRWTIQGSYRFSRLHGTFEGFYRDDNGQSDPGITSLYDFPTDDPSYTAIGVPQFGYRGDIRFLGRLGEGPLPLDRPHQVKAYGTYSFQHNVNVGGTFLLGSGKPLTALAANPVYGSAGEIPESVRGAGFLTSDGFRERTPMEFTVAGHVDWSIGIGGPNRLTFIADVFNLFNRQKALDFDPNTETTFGVLNPDLGQAERFNLAQLQTPRQVRIGVRYEF